MARTSSPSATSWRVTCEPKKPLAPMTSLGLALTAVRPICCIQRAASSSSVPSSCALRHHFIARLQEAQRVVDVFLPTPQAVAGVGDDRDVRRGDHAAVAGVAHRVVEFHDDPPGGLVDDRPQRRERHHVAARKGRHRPLESSRAPARGPSSCPPRARCTRRRACSAATQASQSCVSAARATVCFEFLEGGGQFAARRTLGLVTSRCTSSAECSLGVTA